MRIVSDRDTRIRPPILQKTWTPRPLFSSSAAELGAFAELAALVLTEAPSAGSLARHKVGTTSI